jgi:hypothetical protein
VGERGSGDWLSGRAVDGELVELRLDNVDDLSSGREDGRTYRGMQGR